MTPIMATIKKKVLILLKIVVGLLLLFGFLINLKPIIWFLFPDKPYKIEKTLSPQKDYSVIFEYHTGNATVGYSILIYLEDVQHKNKKLIASIDRYDTVKAKWTETNLLEISFQKASILYGSNYWQYFSQQDLKFHRVEIIFKPLQESSFYE